MKLCDFDNKIRNTERKVLSKAVFEPNGERLLREPVDTESVLLSILFQILIDLFFNLFKIYLFSLTFFEITSFYWSVLLPRLRRFLPADRSSRETSRAACCCSWTS